MTARLSRRDIVRTTVKLAAAGSLGMSRAAIARPSPAGPGGGTFSHVDSILHAATRAEDLPGVVALAATDTGIVYEGVFGRRGAHAGPAMTRDTVFRIASMVKLMTSVAALQLVEQGKLSLDAPVPDIEPELGSPQVLDGFDAAGLPQLRPAKRPISLRHLLTHTSGFTYRLWDKKAVQYTKAIELLPTEDKKRAPRTPLMFDPGERWQYGTSIDWVGRIVEHASGKPLDAYFNKHIFGPLGMSDSGFVIVPEQRAREALSHRRGPAGLLTPQPRERQSSPQSSQQSAQPTPPRSFSGGGGIYSTAPDYLTLIRMLLEGGTLNGARILGPDTVALMGRNQIGNIEAGILKTTVPGASNDVDFFPGISLRWGFGHMINMQAVPDGRSAGSLTWGGLLNTYYWIDPGKRIAAVFMTQVLPFADARVLRVYREFERGVYAAVRSS
jgi:CubicO group peptidase (beta-lactamase class C family)